MSDSWYVVMVRPGRNQVAVDQLRARLSLEVYCPAERQSVLFRGVSVERVRWTFGSYLFALGDLCAPLVWTEVMECSGVFRILGNARPLALPLGVVEGLKAAEDKRAGLTAKAAMEVLNKFKPGTTWRVDEGAFTSFHGVVDEKALDEQNCVRLVLSLFGRATPVAIDPAWLSDSKTDPSTRRYDRVVRGRGFT